MAEYSDDATPTERPVLPSSDPLSIDELLMEKMPPPPVADMPGGWVGRMPNTGQSRYMTEKEIDYNNMVEQSVPPDVLMEMRRNGNNFMQGQLLGAMQNVPTHGQVIDRQYSLPDPKDFRMYRYGPKDDADENTKVPQYGNSDWVRSGELPPPAPITPKPGSPYYRVPMSGEPAMNKWIDRDTNNPRQLGIDMLIQKLMEKQHGG